MIPKVIHYCWFGGGTKPNSVVEMIDSWRENCPGFEIKEWNESNYDVSSHPYMKRALEDKKWSYVSDYARLDIMYNYGGIYLDTDVKVIKNLEPLCDSKGYFGFENDEFVNDGHGFGCEPGLEIIKEMLEVYNEIEPGMYIESPKLRTGILVKHGLVKNGTRQQVEDLEIYPADYFSPLNYMTGRVNTTENTYSIHYYDGTWKTAKEHKYVKLHQFCCRTFGEKRGHVLFEKIVRFKDKLRGR